MKTFVRNMLLIILAATLLVNAVDLYKSFTSSFLVDWSTYTSLYAILGIAFSAYGLKSKNSKESNELSDKECLN